MKKFGILLMISGLSCTFALVALAAKQTPLKLLVERSRIPADELLNPENDAWNTAKKQPLHLNRTPPLYDDGPLDDGERPSVFVQLLSNAGDLFVRLSWKDRTADAGPGQARFPDAGDKHIYKEQSERVNRFADAACVMVPQKKGPHVVLPSLMMGEKGEPVQLFYWRDGMGFQLLDAHGRASVAKTDSVLDGRAVRLLDGWAVVMNIGETPAKTSLAFALWDGAKLHRDGVKYYSLWYELSDE